jgi:hypothetical protein
VLLIYSLLLCRKSDLVSTGIVPFGHTKNKESANLPPPSTTFLGEIAASRDPLRFSMPIQATAKATDSRVLRWQKLLSVRDSAKGPFLQQLDSG